MGALKRQGPWLMSDFMSLRTWPSFLEQMLVFIVSSEDTSGQPPFLSPARLAVVAADLGQFPLILKGFQGL